ncbi:MAG: hypothetical protein ACI84C_002202 [Flavobacteriales bacterium]|jgi:hypothetical protein
MKTLQIPLNSHSNSILAARSQEGQHRVRERDPRINTLISLYTRTPTRSGRTITAAAGNLPAGATLSMSGSGNNQTATICWTPTTAHIGAHYITIDVVDDACHLVGENSELITINAIDNTNDPPGFFGE